MKLIKIDPQAQTIEAIECDGSLNAFRNLIGCRMIDICARQDNGDSLTVDDESLFLEPQPAAFAFNGAGPIHGIALLTGSDDEGETTEPIMTLEEVKESILWLGEIYTKPLLFFISL